MLGFGAFTIYLPTYIHTKQNITATGSGHAAGARALTVGRLSGGGLVAPGLLLPSRHHMIISDVTLASSLHSAASDALPRGGGPPLPLPVSVPPFDPRRSSAASSLTTTLTMGRGVWGQAAAAARAALMVPTCKVCMGGEGGDGWISTTTAADPS